MEIVYEETSDDVTLTDSPVKGVSSKASTPVKLDSKPSTPVVVHNISARDSSLVKRQKLTPNSAPNTTPMETKEHSTPNITPKETKEHSTPNITPNENKENSTPNSARKEFKENSTPVHSLDTRNYSLPKSVVNSYDPHSILKSKSSAPVRNDEIMALQPASSSESESENRPVRPTPGHQRPGSIAVTPSSFACSVLNDDSSKPSTSYQPKRGHKRALDDDDKSESSVKKSRGPSYFSIAGPVSLFTSGVSNPGDCIPVVSDSSVAALILGLDTGKHILFSYLTLMTLDLY